MGNSDENLDLPGLASSAILSGVFVALLLACIKYVILLLTGSASIRLSFFDSCFDASVSTVNYWATRLSFKKHKKYAYGYDKITGIAAVVQVLALLSCMCSPVLDAIAILSTADGFLINESSQFLNVPLDSSSSGIPIETEHTRISTDFLHGNKAAILALIVSSVLTIALIRYQSYVLEKTGHLVVSADRVHYTTDLLTNFSMLACFILMFFVDVKQHPWILLFDPALTIVLSIYICLCCAKVLVDAWKTMMDCRLPPEKETSFIEDIYRHDHEKTIKKAEVLSSRFSGVREYFKVQLHVDAGTNVAEEKKLRERLRTIFIKKNVYCDLYCVPAEV